MALQFAYESVSLSADLCSLENLWSLVHLYEVVAKSEASICCVDSLGPIVSILNSIRANNYPEEQCFDGTLDKTNNHNTMILNRILNHKSAYYTFTAQYYAE